MIKRSCISVELLYSISTRPGFLYVTISGANAVSTRDTMLTIVTGWADQQHSPHPRWEIVRSRQCVGAAPTAQQRNLDSLSAELHWLLSFTAWQAL